MDTLTIAERLRSMRERIELACAKSGRPAGSVKLLAVSKTQSATAVREAYASGQRDFGENYVQELAQKAEELADLPDLRWHAIGHVQTNKARVIAPLCHCVHSVGSLRLIDELERRVNALGRSRSTPPRSSRSSSPTGPSPECPRLDVLLAVNVGAEAQKSGCTPEELPELLTRTRASSSLRAVGLMTIPPLGETPEASRPYFEKLRDLRELHGGSTLLPELSMGMSADCEVAIDCGATWVRLGTAIFGTRRPRA